MTKGESSCHWKKTEKHLAVTNFRTKMVSNSWLYQTLKTRFYKFLKSKNIMTRNQKRKKESKRRRRKLSLENSSLFSLRLMPMRIWRMFIRRSSVPQTDTLRATLEGAKIIGLTVNVMKSCAMTVFSFDNMGGGMHTMCKRFMINKSD